MLVCIFALSVGQESADAGLVCRWPYLAKPCCALLRRGPGGTERAKPQGKLRRTCNCFSSSGAERKDFQTTERVRAAGWPEVLAYDSLVMTEAPAPSSSNDKNQSPEKQSCIPYIDALWFCYSTRPTSCRLVISAVPFSNCRALQLLCTS